MYQVNFTEQEFNLLINIHKKELMACSFEARYSVGLYFKEQVMWNIKNALFMAYMSGKNNK